MSLKNGGKKRPKPDRVRDKLLMRLPPTESRQAAFNKLHKALGIATEIFEHQGDGGRHGVMLAIDAVFKYCMSRGIPPATLEPLAAVSSAIVDAERGASSSIFEPTRHRKGGTPPANAQQVAFEGHLAVIAECCVRHCKAEGMRPFVEPGTIMAATMVNASKWPVIVSATQMREFRERVSQNTNANSPDRIVFNAQTTSPTFKVRPLDWAKLLLEHEWVIVPNEKNPSNPPFKPE